MISRMDVDKCPHNRYFADEDRICQNCTQAQECLWLNSIDDFSMLAEQPINQLFEAFSFSVDYVDSHVAREKHNCRRCICETCTWVRDARHLSRQYLGLLC